MTTGVRRPFKIAQAVLGYWLRRNVLQIFDAKSVIYPEKSIKTMRPNDKSEHGQQGLLGNPELDELLDQRHDLYRLGNAIGWERLEASFVPLYAQRGRPGLPIRRMAGLLILKQLYNLSDEGVCERWRESPYMQYFCGVPSEATTQPKGEGSHFRWGYPCTPSELVHFRKRIGEEGVSKIFEESIRLACR